jgi:quinol monooxygenase YgiN
MAIYTIAEYQVRPSGVDKVQRAIEEFVPYVQANESNVRGLATERRSDVLCALFIFEGEAAHTAHSRSEAVKRFEAARTAGGDVVFRDYHLVATNQR